MNKFFKNIGFFFGKRHLKRNLINRRLERKTMSFSEAKNIGVLFVAHTDHDLQTAHQYIDELKQQGKEVSYIGLIMIKDYKRKNKEFSHSNYIFDSDFDLFHRPKRKFILKFYKQEFDILISLNYTHQFSLNYIASLSHAKLRIGKYHINNINAYDFMIDHSGIQLEDFIKPLNHYLNQIKNE